MNDREKMANVRANLVNQINVAVGDLAKAEDRVHRARSELGTAEAEHEKIVKQYEQLVHRLNQTLPSIAPMVGIGIDAVDLSRLAEVGASVRGLPVRPPDAPADWVPGSDPSSLCEPLKPE